MAATEALQLAALGHGDIPAAHALSDAVGWNQTAADWAVFFSRGRGIGFHGPGGQLIATAAILPYGEDFGWISMVIVQADWRRRGLARRLMGECIAMLRADGRAALLDATPAGAQVYAGLGFVPLCGLERWDGQGGGVAHRALPADHDALIAADADAFGADRRFLLDDFLARPDSAAYARGGSFLVIRAGHRALQIGPLIAAAREDTHDLLDATIASAQGRIMLDLMEPWSDLSRLLEARGFRRQRPFVRMALGRAALPGDPAALAIAAGPEFG